MVKILGEFKTKIHANKLYIFTPVLVKLGIEKEVICELCEDEQGRYLSVIAKSEPGEIIDGKKFEANVCQNKLYLPQNVLYLLNLNKFDEVSCELVEGDRSFFKIKAIDKKRRVNFV